jgi:hypothetical protein
MIKLSILYPNKRETEVDAGLQGTAPGADIPRYTDMAPRIQFNELKLAV